MQQRESGMAIVDSLIPEFDHEMATTRKVLERVPEERFDWKPHEKSFSLRVSGETCSDAPNLGHRNADAIGNRPRRQQPSCVDRLEERVAERLR